MTFLYLVHLFRSGDDLLTPAHHSCDITSWGPPQYHFWHPASGIWYLGKQNTFINECHAQKKSQDLSSSNLLKRMLSYSFNALMI